MTTRERWEEDYRILRCARRGYREEPTEAWFLQRWGWLPGAFSVYEHYNWGTQPMTDEQFERWQQCCPENTTILDWFGFMLGWRK